MASRKLAGRRRFRTTLGGRAMVTASVLVVEDDWVSREILLDSLGEAGYDAVSAEDGETAWSLIEAHPQRFEAILLDRLLPGIDGLEVLRRIKDQPALRYIPVIMQTGLSEPEEVLEGLKAGAYYYLTKPFAPEQLLAIVNTAVGDARQNLALQQQARQTVDTLKHLRQAEFAFRTPQDVQEIASLLAAACADGQRVVLGLSELMLNAVEHGNLGISYGDKSRLIAEDRLHEEIELRLVADPYRDRVATIHFERAPDCLRFAIRDEGEGFEWQDYMELKPERAFNTHGRGIAMARMLSFDALEYRGKGNEVVATLRNGASGQALG